MTTPGGLRRDARFVPVVVGLVAGVVYGRTVLPGMAFGDWGEMQTVPHVLGVAHPTGYPTYVVLGWLAQLVPIGSVALRANLLSVVLVAATVAVTAAILLRLGVRPLLAGAAALAFGAVRTVWSAATVAEVDPLHLLLVGLLVHRALVWADERRPRDLYLGALLLGLALSNHLLTLFVAPFVVGYVLWAGRREIAARPTILGVAGVALVAGLTPYLYIPLAASRAPVLAYNDPVTLGSFAWLVGGTQFRGQFGFLSTEGLATFATGLGPLWSTLARAGSPVLPALGLVGLVVLTRRRPAFGLAVAGVLVAALYAWSTYLRLGHYLLVPWLVLAVGAAVAVETAIRVVERWGGPLRLPAARLVVTACLAFAVALTAVNWRASDRSGDMSAAAFTETVLPALPPRAAILSQWDTTTPLWHAQYVLGERPDVLVVDDTDVVFGGWRTRERLIASLICERPVFILRLRDHDLVATRERYRLEPFLTVHVAIGGASAVATRHVYLVRAARGQCTGPDESHDRHRKDIERA